MPQLLSGGTSKTYLAAAPSSASSLDEFAWLESPPSLLGPLPTCLIIPHLPSLPLPPTQGPAAGVMGATGARINVGEDWSDPGCLHCCVQLPAEQCSAVNELLTGAGEGCACSWRFPVKYSSAERCPASASARKLSQSCRGLFDMPVAIGTTSFL